MLENTAKPPFFYFAVINKSKLSNISSLSQKWIEGNVIKDWTETRCICLSSESLWKQPSGDHHTVFVCFRSINPTQWSNNFQIPTILCDCHASDFKPDTQRSAPQRIHAVRQTLWAPLELVYIILWKTALLSLVRWVTGVCGFRANVKFKSNKE